MTTTLPAPTTTPIRLIVPVSPRASVEIEVGPHDLRIGDRCASFDAVDAIAYSTRSQRANLVQRRVRRRVWISADDRILQLRLGELAFGRQFDETWSLAHHTIVAALHDNVERRLRTAMVCSLQERAVITIGPVELDRTGLALWGRGGIRSHHPWRHVPIAELYGDHVTLSEGRNGRLITRISADVPNAVLLPELLLSGAAALV